jgi:ribonuclease HI
MGKDWGRKAYVYTDGACKSTGGIGGIGAWILDPKTGEVIKEVCACIGEKGTPWGTETTSNNIAEYEAVILGVMTAVCEGINTIKVHCDNELVVNQAMGVWECKKPHLQPLLARLHKWIDQPEIRWCKFVWVPREQNKMADKLSRLGQQTPTVFVPSMAELTSRVLLEEKPGLFKGGQRHIVGADVQNWVRTACG